MNLLMAGEIERIRALVFQEPPDSGIDSDDPVRGLMRASDSTRTSSDESGSCDECQASPHAHGWRNIEQRPEMKDSEDEEDIIQWPQEQFTPQLSGDNTPDRSSPPLYEVELTASDEDDDASVLELVIPMNSSRYQRVPTSSPKKPKPKVVKRYFCSMICCGRK
ncbi:unnamed protein product [Chrysodeixis includens]|uniref:Uncharacterized protein n=1 Tax=Chrysodeixis includens TaxID=689277 RepID=A0A9P0BUI6_CHRIL|nr:unnamed protein product [Chrysodeixis includens]